jgi:hypothetical protein
MADGVWEEVDNEEAVADDRIMADRHPKQAEEVLILYLLTKENEFCNEEELEVTNLWKQKDEET